MLPCRTRHARGCTALLTPRNSFCEVRFGCDGTQWSIPVEEGYVLTVQARYSSFALSLDAWVTEVTQQLHMLSSLTATITNMHARLRRSHFPHQKYMETMGGHKLRYGYARRPTKHYSLSGGAAAGPTESGRKGEQILSRTLTTERS